VNRLTESGVLHLGHSLEWDYPWLILR